MSAAPVTASAPAIRLAGVTKVYSRTEARADTLKERLISSLSVRQRSDLVIALEDINLGITPGELLGLIGPNGSGKSTLLKIIAGITRPSQGSVHTEGRILGLIELGAGFHPELTGDENIRLQGAIYGLDAAQVEAAIEPILDFAELRDFRSMPVKHYSSGMYVRLGFAIAMHARPDLLLVDEVLAVGDQDFQERCLREIRRLNAAGVTILFVTHYPEQAERLCDRVLWLEGGQTRMLGPATDVLAAYHDDMIGRRHGRSQGRLDRNVIMAGVAGRYGSGEARIEAVRLLDQANRPRTSFRPGESFRFEIDFSAQPGIDRLGCTIPIDDVRDGFMVSLTHAERDYGLIDVGPDGRGTIRVEFDNPPLLAGRYRVTIALSPPNRPSEHYDVLYRLFHLVIDSDPDWETVAPIQLRPRLA